MLIITRGLGILQCIITRGYQYLEAIWVKMADYQSVSLVGYQRIVDTGLQRARAGQTIHKWVNDLTPGNGMSVVTNTGLVYNLSPNEQIVITEMHVGLMTASDYAHIELVCTDVVDGAGNVTPITHHTELNTGTTKPELPMHQIVFNPPHVATYSSGCRSITMRVNMNDASAQVTLAWNGWTELEDNYPGDA